MHYVLYTNDAICEEFVRSRRASATRLKLGTPSFLVVMIERLAGGFRRVSAGIERWAAGSSDSPLPRQLSIR